MTKIKSVRLWCFFSALLMVSSCGQETPSLPDTNVGTTSLTGVVVTAGSPSTTITVQIVNAKDGSTIAATSNATVIGTSVIDPIGKTVTSLVSQNGFISFSLKETVVPTATNPVNLTVVVEHAGYTSTSIPISLTSVGSYNYTARLVNPASPPIGVVAKRNITAAAVGVNGVTLKKITTQTAIEPYSQATAQITIPVGTVITDAYGSALQGDLYTTVSYYNNQIMDSLGSFPGGFNATVNKADGTSAQGNFISGGFIAIDVVDANGTKGVKFNDPYTTNKPLNITTQMPAGAINPNTGLPVANGDTIPIWSYEPTTGVWTEEGVQTISLAPGSKIANVTFNVNHLSYFNMDWHYSPVCKPRIELGAASKGLNIRVTAEIVGFYSSGSSTWGDTFMDINNLPKGYPLTFIASYEGVELARINTTLPNDNTCPIFPSSGQEYKIQLDVTAKVQNLPKAETPEVYTVRVPAADCGAYKIASPSATFYYRPKVTGGYMPWSTSQSQLDANDVVISAKLLPNKLYESWVYVSGYYSIGGKTKYIHEWYQKDFTSPANGSPTERTIDTSKYCPA